MKKNRKKIEKSFEKFTNESTNESTNDKGKEKIEVECSDCNKKFKTTQEWFDQKNVDGKLKCRKCRIGNQPKYIKPEANSDDAKKIEVTCPDCDKKFKTTKAWFDQRNVDGELKCRKCRLS